MITLTVDPTNPERLILTATVTMFLDRVLVTSLDAAIADLVKDEAARSLRTNQGEVRRRDCRLCRERAGSA
jgi:hypothetical protein